MGGCELAMRRRIRVGDADIDALTLNDSVVAICELARGSTTRAFVVTPNIHHILELRGSEPFRDAYRDAALVLPDGFPVALAMRALGARNQSRVAGADLVPALCRAAATEGLTVGFLGGQPGAAARAAARSTAEHPTLQVVLVEEAAMGFDSTPQTREPVLVHVVRKDPDILFVGLGAPKQELFVAANRHHLGTGVAVCVGAGIDFAAGVARRSPGFLQKVGLEWAWRLVNEPRRLAKRYAKAAPVFVWLVTPSILRRIRRPAPGRSAASGSGRGSGAGS
ncbi:MAG: hypothetical protein JWP11_1135 [Frankiales bacterium]|nr:hypothetical protein [Frankiales bacterium]